MAAMGEGTLVDFRDLTVSYGAVPALAGVSGAFPAGPTGLLGPNGAGKTTLLKTLLGKLPAQGGTVRRGHEVKIAVFDQRLSELDDDRSLVEEIRAVRADLSPDAVRNYLARFRFFGDDVFRVVRGLSGGERYRLTLAKMMLRPANVLALDEPTNHLDIPAREVLERALRAYEGTLLVVSHDRFFLDEVVTRLLVVEGDRIELETGNYSDWKRRRTAARAARPEKAAAAPAPKKEPSAAKQSFAEEKARKAEREKLERRFAALETEIAELERALTAVRERLSGDHAGDWQKLHGLVEEERSLDQKLRSRMGEWEKLGERLGL